MPEWVMNELNKIVGETLVGNGWKGGLNLIDLKDGNKNKNGEEIYGKTVDYGWRDFLRCVQTPGGESVKVAGSHSLSM